MGRALLAGDNVDWTAFDELLAKRRELRCAATTRPN